VSAVYSLDLTDPNLNSRRTDAGCMKDLLDTLPLYALDVLSAEEVEAVEQALREQPHLATLLTALRATAADLVAAAPAVKPSPHVRQRLLASIGAGRFERFTPAFSRIFDLSLEAARELLAWIDDPSKWQQVMPHFAAIHFAGGPACRGADTGFVRLAPGGVFPYHGHRGDELTLVLLGTATASDGRILRAGEENFEIAGTAHDFANTGEGDFIYATRAFGVQFGIVRPVE
jgi:Cupin domain